MATNKKNAGNNVVVAFDIDFTMTTGANHKQVFEEKYPSLDFDKHFDVYPIDESLIKYGFEGEGFKRFAIYQEHSRELFGESPLEPWFLELYNRIKDLDWVDIHFITARNTEYSVYTEELFKQHNLPFDNVHHIGGHHKEELVQELGVALIFEDHVGTIERILSCNKHCYAGKINRRYNQTGFEHPRMVDVYIEDDVKQTAHNLCALLETLRGTEK